MQTGERQWEADWWSEESGCMGPAWCLSHVANQEMLMSTSPIFLPRKSRKRKNTKNKICWLNSVNEHQPIFLPRKSTERKNTKKIFCWLWNANEHKPHFLTKEIHRKKKENTKRGNIILIRKCLEIWRYLVRNWHQEKLPAEKKDGKIHPCKNGKWPGKDVQSTVFISADIKSTGTVSGTNLPSV